MRKNTVTRTFHCPQTHAEEWVELTLAQEPVFQLHPPQSVSCTQREDASDCGNCLSTPRVSRES